MTEATTTPVSTGVHTLDIRFTGQGSEYFRIWIVNLLLTIVTLGIYFPWAKVRKLRYFYGNTLVGGDPLDFHGDPRKMLRGYLLVGLLLILYSLAGQFSVLAGVVAVVAVLALVPALIRAAMRFRLANTSWRGLRFHFTGTTGGAYRALLWAFLPLALFVLSALVWSPKPGEEDKINLTGAFVMVALMLIAFAWSPVMLWALKRFQHGNLALGEEHTKFSAGPGRFYALALKVFGCTVVVTLMLSLFMMILGNLTGSLGLPTAASAPPSPDAPPAAPSAAFLFGLFAGYLFMITAIFAFSQTFTQNLVWPSTASPSIRFRSELAWQRMLGVSFMVLLLSILTLGLYLPFGAIRLAKLRLESVTVESTRNPDELVASFASDQDATGDVAGDLFGFDIGF